MSVADAARILSMNEKTTISRYNSLRLCMFKDLLEGGSAKRSGDRETLLKSMNRSLGNASSTVDDGWWANGSLRDADGEGQRENVYWWSTLTTNVITTLSFALSKIGLY